MPLNLPNYEENLRVRTEKWLATSGGTEEELRKNRAREWNKCKYDIIYWIETYGWLYNPKFIDVDGFFPAALYEYQKELILFLRNLLEDCNKFGNHRKENVALLKCRETAGSWSGCFVTVHDWLFWNGMHLWFSRKEEEVDQGGNMDTPFEKMRSILRRLPDWMMPRGWNWRHHSKVRLLENPEGGSIEGEAMTNDGGAGGRKRCVWFDEFARTQKGADFSSWRSCSMTTNLRIAICSPEGPDNKFAYLCTGKEEEKCIVVKLAWWKDPSKMQGAEWEDGAFTSPWYRVCEEAFDSITLNSQVLLSFDKSKGGTVMEGYSDATHSKPLTPVRGCPIIIGLDPGPHFAASFTQLLPCKCYRVLRQRYWGNADIDKVGEEIIQILNIFYPGFERKFCGDPAGNHVNSAMQKSKSDYMYLMQKFKMDIAFRFMFAIPREDWVRARVQSAVVKMKQYCDKCKNVKFLVDSKNAPEFKAGCGGDYRYICGPDGVSTGIIDEFHPIEDAMDSGLYPLLYTGQFIPQDQQKGSIRVPDSNRGWMPPSQHRSA